MLSGSLGGGAFTVMPPTALEQNARAPLGSPMRELLSTSRYGSATAVPSSLALPWVFSPDGKRARYIQVRGPEGKFVALSELDGKKVTRAR
jgi:hypothetical protein